MTVLTLKTWRTRSFWLALCLVAGLSLLPLAATPARAQDGAKPRPKDDALDGLLKDIKKAKADEAKPDPKPEQAKPGKAADAPKAKTEAKKPVPDVAAKDKGLDSLLEKLGETRDKPSPDDRRGPGGPPPPEEKPGAGGKGKADPLTGKSKDLDEHLEELTGKKKSKNQDKSKGDDGGGPLGEVVKGMRDVEQRLGQTDTGEETRKKQQQIVKKLESVIEQMKSSSSQGKKSKSQMAMKAGQKPGQDQGQTPGSTGGNAPHAKPADPNKKRSLAGGKDAWGHLPPELRQELENVFKEDFLPSREELIQRYYEAVNKKRLSRGE